MRNDNKYITTENAVSLSVRPSLRLLVGISTFTVNLVNCDLKMEKKHLKTKEISIPVPWGHVAAKAWGDENNPPILVFHGRMDNAGAFDNLIPLLPDSYYYICCDLPSHGKSSHFPPYLPIYSLNYMLVYKIIMKYFQKKSYILIGHSYGAHLGLLYARLYPDEIQKLVMIDTIHLDGVPVPLYKTYLARKFEFHLNLLDKLSSGTQPKYTYEEAKDRLQNNRENEPLTEAAATGLLNRGLESVGNGKYVYTLDQRMKNYLDQMYDLRYMVESFKHDPVLCPVLMILAKKNFKQTSSFLPILNTMEKYDNVSVKHVEGGHDLHNNNPEIVAPLINKFLAGQGKLTQFKQKL